MAFYSSITSRIKNAINARLHKLYVFADTSTMHYPQFYLGSIIFIALLGYAYLLMFPVLFLASLFNIYETLTSDTINWTSTFTWLAIGVAAGLVTYSGTRVKPTPPVGLKLSEDKAPKLFELVQQLKTTYGRLDIDRIVITGDYEVDIIKTPKWALPVWSMNTMVIGLPSLQCHTPENFSAIVARRIGQFSKRNNPITNWLYQLRTIWPQYYLAYKKNKAAGTEVLTAFLYLFSPFYSAVSSIAAKLDELKADSYAIEERNDEVMREMITADTLYRWYLENEYWPAVYKLTAISEKAKPTPHAKMAPSLRNKLDEEKIAALIDKMMKVDSSWNVAIPSLTSRIENIGHEHPRMRRPEGETAAEFYLGDSLSGVTNLIDTLWLKNLIEKNKG
jgi:hypothetical protein